MTLEIKFKKIFQNCSTSNVHNFWFCWKQSLFLQKKKVIKIFSCATFQFDLQIAIPEGYFGKIESRLSLA